MKYLWLALALLPLSAHAATPLNCDKASNITEHTVCSTPSLLQADARMTAYFEIATQFVAMGGRGALYDAQKAFPAQRDRCHGDKACIKREYDKATAPLEVVIARVKTHGPF